MAILLAVALSDCGFHPLYGEIGSKPGGQQVFGTIYVDTIPTERIGYELRNNLINMMHGSVKQDGAIYRLTVTTTQGNEGIAVEPNASITRYNFNLVAHYELSNIHNGKVVQSGSEATLAEYDVVSSPYSTLVAQRAAEEHATEDIANRIRIALAVYFHNQAK
ncbi:MAG: LPS assembly lipoprotein LptE [Rhizomicrobium sp.]